ncbi:hypothetical protein BH10BDE1_BH10BDE1_03530 [soil metagenome]
MNSFFKLSLLIAAMFGATVLLSTTAFAASAAKSARCEAMFTAGKEPPPILEPLSEREIKLAIRNRAQVAREFRTSLRMPIIDASHQIALVLEGDVTAATPVTLKDIVLNEPQSTAVARNKLLTAYVKLVKQFGRPVTEVELADAVSLKVDELKVLFGDGLLYANLEAVKKEAQARKPEAFKKFIDLEFFTPARQQALIEAVTNRQRLFVTTAVAATRVHKDFLESLLRAREEMDAEILVFAANMEVQFLDPILLNTPGIHIITESILLNPDIRLNNIKLVAKQMNPLMGLARLYPRGESQIVGSPKLHFDTVPTVRNEYSPHFLSTTAAITEANYNGKHYIQDRTNAIAKEDHVIGALLLEKSMGETNTALPEDAQRSGFYHMRHVTYNEEHRGFMDLNRFYPVEGSSRRIQVPILPFPDLHIGEVNEKVARSLIATLKFFGTEYLIAHDFFNGHSVSKHDRDKAVSSTIAFQKGRLSLQDELLSGVVALNAIMDANPKLKILVPEANHNDWLTRYLQEGQFMKEVHNRALGAELYNFMVNGDGKESVLMYAYKKLGLEHPNRIVFLEENSFYTKAFEFGQHGHQGSNGGKGSMNTMVRAANGLVFGHTHTTGRRGDTMNIGTSTDLRLNYSRLGASSWGNSLSTISDYGAQLLMWTNGELYASEKVQAGLSFFPPGYPKAIPNGDPNDGMQVDQHSRFVEGR